MFKTVALNKVIQKVKQNGNQEKKYVKEIEVVNSFRYGLKIKKNDGKLKADTANWMSLAIQRRGLAVMYWGQKLHQGRMGDEGEI